jgi:hypothetical protein
MQATTNSLWSPADYCLTANIDDPHEALATTAYERVCRVDFAAPGFCLINLGPDASSVSLRRFMVNLKQAMEKIHQQRKNRDLVFLSAARFDQQVTTKLHRDGGPDECFLMLGYEPSQVPSAIALADYSQCAYSMGITPHELLQKHNPMFGPGEQLLRPFTTRVECFTNRNYQVALINNSMAPYATAQAWQGVLHTATIEQPMDELRRVVNSTMIASVPRGTEESVSELQQEEFINTNIVRRRGYDKQHLEDDM